MDMDLTLIQKLNDYCDGLIGGSTPSKLSKKEKTKKKKEACGESPTTKCNEYGVTTENDKQKRKSKKKDSITFRDLNEEQVNDGYTIAESHLESVELNSESTQDASSKEIKDEPQNGCQVTEDGFKVVSSIPEDDSDISDAFESDIGEEEGWSSPKNWEKVSQKHCGKLKVTDDGFKVISDIPPDDSDVSDAFSDGEDLEGTGEDLIAQRKQLISTKTPGKPILKMIDDFGLGNDILQKEKSETNNIKATKKNARAHRAIYGIQKTRKRKKKTKGPYNTATLASEQKPKVDVTVFDYTQKIGAKKTSSRNAKKHSSLTQRTKEELEREMKKMRFDIFKLGMTGFEKKERKETRIALAIKLGAKPHKNKFVNYKDLLTSKREGKVKEKEERELKREMGIKEKKFKPNPSKTKKKPRAFTAQVGRYKDGVQYLSKKDIAKINNS